jgi:kynurenine formamidase
MMKEVSSLLKAMSESKIYDLEFQRYMGMPERPGQGIPYVYTLNRYHETERNSEGADPRTSAAGFVFHRDHSGTHIDALCHQADDMKLYGNISVNRLTETRWGFSNHGAETIPPIIKRGVLLDVPALKNCECLPERYEITLDDVKNACEALGVKFERNGVILIRTGYGRFWDRPEKYLSGAGISKEASSWIAEKEPYAVGADNSAWDLADAGKPLFGHLHLLARHGIHIMENVFLEELSRDRCYEFVFVGLPLKYKGATGSPFRPIALGSMTIGVSS